ncbi:Mss4p nuclear export [Ascosphaera acerosa]|nr:Mss4p nuclear export [Ascosphaera acerosa]
MGKRKQLKDADGDAPMGGSGQNGTDSSDEVGFLAQDMDTVNVDFEWFDPQPAHDFHGLKVLLRQLFDNDAQAFDLSALADLILAQPLLGSTVKTEGNESDPYAFLTVLNLQQHRDKPVIQALTKYLTQKASAARLAPLHALLSQSLVPAIGLILTERLINVPAEVVPPMYAMLQEEIQWALDEGEPYSFTHYLIVSRAYVEVRSQIDADVEDDRPAKKGRGKKGGAARQKAETTFPFHPEDEILRNFALCAGDYDWTHEAPEGASDSKRAFHEWGIKTLGHMILIEAGRFEAAVNAMKEAFSP